VYLGCLADRRAGWRNRRRRSKRLRRAKSSSPSKLVSQLKALMPVWVKNLKSTMLIGRSPDFVPDVEAMLPTLMAEMQSTTTNSAI
jgi:hypothetical protein